MLLAGCTDGPGTDDAGPAHGAQPPAVETSADAEPPAQCQAVYGSEPWLTLFGGGEPVCILVADDQDVQVWNKGTEPMVVVWRGGRDEVASDDHVDTGPAGRALAAGPNPFAVTPYNDAVVWRLTPEQSPSAGLDRTDDRLGAVEVGMTVAEAVERSGLSLAVDVDLAVGPVCWIAVVERDPYSPLLVVRGDGSTSSEIVAITTDLEPGC